VKSESDISGLKQEPNNHSVEKIRVTGSEGLSLFLDSIIDEQES
jgi:hypothetical protein